MSVKTISQAFDDYQKSRLLFATTLADLADRPHLIDCLRSFKAVELLNSLLNDPVNKVQQNACVAMGRLLGGGGAVVQEAVDLNIIPNLLMNFDKRTKYYKKGAMMALKGISKHNEAMASIVLHKGGLDSSIHCLENFDVGVKETGCWVISSISRHNEKLASTIAASGAIGLLRLCLMEPETSLKQVAVLALTDIAKHNAELATLVIDNGCLPPIVKNLGIDDAKLKKSTLCGLSHIGSHNEELAETIIVADVFPQGLYHLAHPDQNVRMAAASLIREIVKHNLQICTWLVNSGAVAGLLEAINLSNNCVRLPAIMALGYIASHDEEMAMIIITSEGVSILKPILSECKDDSVLSVLVWTLGHLGKYSSEHAKSIAEKNIFNDILEIYTRENLSEELRQKCKRTLKQILEKCSYTPALEGLIHNAPPDILKSVLLQFTKILPNDPVVRRKFVTSGCLEKVQLLKPVPGSSLFEYVSVINHCFPDEIVRYYSPGYSDALLDQIDKYTPQIPPIFPDTASLCSIDDGEQDFDTLPTNVC